MNATLKKLLKGAGLYDFAARSYHMYQHFTWERLKLQFIYRLKGAPDGYPVPPPRLVHKIIARGWAEQYWNLGIEDSQRLLDVLSENKVDLKPMKTILDFGCGCGRVIRHFLPVTEAQLHGCDYNKSLIRWCQKKLTFGRFYVNSLRPPLEYEDEQFDLIYLRSVFTHLDQELQRQWMQELLRISRPGGYIMFTAHGRPFLSFLSEEQRKRFEADELVTFEDDKPGSNHFASFQSVGNVRGNLLEGCTLVDHSEGPGELQHDVYLLRKTGW